MSSEPPLAVSGRFDICFDFTRDAGDFLRSETRDNILDWYHDNAALP